MAPPPPLIRQARLGDTAGLAALIRRSAAGLSGGRYDPTETNAATEHIFGVDSELIVDGTYFVVTGAMGEPLGCGGWSRRDTLFGGDQVAGRSSRLLDPIGEAARIRAFFVAPEAARRGIAAALLARCEAEARAVGFGELVLMATLPGVPFYTRHGFVAGTAMTVMAGSVTVRFVPMEKRL